MMQLRAATERGHANHGWLDSWHTFSFADYYDPNFMGFRALRVINEDRIAEGGGFPTHGHKDMEIVTFVISGELEHQDTLGHKEIIRPGEIQKMSAGTGIRHSEFNPSDKSPTHLLQIWILPGTSGLKPGYAQMSYRDRMPQNSLLLLGSEDGHDDSIVIHQDVRIYLGRLDAGKSLGFSARPHRYGWLQMVSGELKARKQTLKAGDALAFYDEPELAFQAQQESEFLLFDLA